MEIWIRSQDRHTLTECITVGVDETRVMIIGKYGGRLTLGNYKTEQRALEVVDEIQKQLRPKGIVKLNCVLNTEELQKIKDKYPDYLVPNNHYTFEKISMDNFIFEMPKE